MNLTNYDIALLTEMNGGPKDPSLRWGAAMSASIEYMRSVGLIAGLTNIKITEKGKEYLNGLKSATGDERSNP